MKAWLEKAVLETGVDPFYNSNKKYCDQGHDWAGESLPSRHYIVISSCPDPESQHLALGNVQPSMTLYNSVRIAAMEVHHERKQNGGMHFTCRY